MAYTQVDHTATRCFEVLMPARFRCAVLRILDDLFSFEAFSNIPTIAGRKLGQQELAELHQRCRRCISGYSIYEVDGRFWSDRRNAVDDERTLIVRFIVVDRDFAPGMNADVARDAVDIITNLVAFRLANEVGQEDESWFVEYQHCIVRRLVSVEGPAVSR